MQTKVWALLRRSRNGNTFKDSIKQPSFENVQAIYFQ